MEMYEQQDPFKLTDFITMSYFLNQFLYKAVLTNLFGKISESTSRRFFLRSLNSKVVEIEKRKSYMMPVLVFVLSLTQIYLLIDFVNIYKLCEFNLISIYIILFSKKKFLMWTDAFDLI